MTTAPTNEPLSRNVLTILLAICLIGIGAVIFLVLRPDSAPPESIIQIEEVETAPVTEPVTVNVMQVTDVTTNPAVIAQEGGRYKVLIVDEAKEGASGITRIGGLVTFVPNTQKGDVVVIEVTRIKRSTADAVVIEKVASGQPVPETPLREPQRPAQTERKPAGAMAGQTHKVTITDTGREGDGVAKVGGKVVFVSGAVKGDYVEIKIVEDVGRFARAEVVAKLDRAAEGSAADKGEKPVKVGEIHTVTVTEADRRQPDVNGVARIQNFVIFVPGAKMGDQVRIRITELRERSAMSEVIEHVETSTPAP